MFIEPQEFNTAQELRNHYKQVRERIFTPPAPKAPPRPETPILAHPVALVEPLEATPEPKAEPQPLPAVIPMQKIIDVVCVLYQINENFLRSPRRFHNISYARMLVYYFARNKTLLSFPAIGRILGGRDHSSVLSGCRKIDRLFNAGDERTVKAIAAIERALGV